jgi:hypothetical protein
MTRSGIVVTGIILFIFGVLGRITPVYNGRTIIEISDLCKSGLGQVGQFFSTQIQQNCEIASDLADLVYALIGIGIILIIIGSVLKSHKKSAFICGYCDYVTDIEADLYNHYEAIHMETRQKEQERSEQVKSNTYTPTHYDILGVGIHATQEEITKQYRKLVLVWHPDQNRTKQDAAEYFKIINESYEVLRDKDKRKEYNKSLGL